MGIQPRFTNAGKDLHLRALDGEPIVFTKIQIGSGELEQINFRTLNALIDPKATLPISDIKVQDGYAAIRAYFKNTEITEGFYYRELGLFAKDPDDPSREILYAYGNSGRNASYIADPGSEYIERVIKIISVVDDAENVSAVINGSSVYVDFVELREKIEEHNSDLNAHPNFGKKSISFYFDCRSTEADEICDGSYLHPFKSFSALERPGLVPDELDRLNIFLKTFGTYDAPEFNLSESIENVFISYSGNINSRPVFTGRLAFDGQKSVSIRNIKFDCSNETYGPGQTALLIFNDCKSVIISQCVCNCSEMDDCIFIEASNSDVMVNYCETYNVQRAVDAYNYSSVRIRGRDGSLETSGESPVSLYDSEAYVYIDDCDVDISGNSLVFDKEMIDGIVDGTIINHLSSRTNPHKVSLEHAQREGGVVNAEHGGTGQETLTDGAVLLGRGTDPVGFARGRGAFYANEAGSPVFGTLPVALGGTGSTSFANGSIVKMGVQGNMVGVAGTGALHAITSGSPSFGTLPVSAGGTGATSFENGDILYSGSTKVNGVTGIGAVYKNATAGIPIIGTLPNNFGGTGRTDTGTVSLTGASSQVKGAIVGIGGIMVVWGHTGIESSDTSTAVTLPKAFANTNYSVIFNTFNNNYTDPEKEVRKITFKRNNLVGYVGFDWVAIGAVAES